MQFADRYITGSNTGFLVRGRNSTSRHIEPHKIHRAARVQRGRISHECLASYQDRLPAELGPGVEEALRDDYRGSGAVARGAALEFGEGRVYHGGFEDVLEAVGLPELGVGVALGVLVADAGDFCEVFGAGAVSGVSLAVIRYVSL